MMKRNDKEGPGGNDDGLPAGWSAEVDPNSGNTYYAHTDGRSQWERLELKNNVTQTPKEMMIAHKGV